MSPDAASSSFLAPGSPCSVPERCCSPTRRWLCVTTTINACYFVLTYIDQKCFIPNRVREYFRATSKPFDSGMGAATVHCQQNKFNPHSTDSSVYTTNIVSFCEFILIYTLLFFKLSNRHLESDQLVAVMPSCGKDLKDPDITKLKNWHPATGGYVNSTNDPNIDRVDPALTNRPSTKFGHLSLIWP